MICSGGIFMPSLVCAPHNSGWRQRIVRSHPSMRWRVLTSGDADSLPFAFVDSADKSPPGFCIIEGPETIRDLAKMEWQEIQDHIKSRRNKIFLLMEEVRRLRIQQRLKNAELGILKEDRENELPDFPSFIPFFPPLTPANLKMYYATCFSLIVSIMIFGGLLAPTILCLVTADSRQHIGAPSSWLDGKIIGAAFVSIINYGGVIFKETAAFASNRPTAALPQIFRAASEGGIPSGSIIQSLLGAGAETRIRWHILCRFYPQFAFANPIEVDPIVASFTGGAVGVISALMVVEINNIKQQEQKRCKYCLGTGYLTCARCSGAGTLVLLESVVMCNGDDQPLMPPRTERCSNCSGSGKVMCPTCLCTGMEMASEHDPRIDPFD